MLPIFLSNKTLPETTKFQNHLIIEIMKKKTLLDSVDVPIPCDKSWDEMIGNDVLRLCLHCEKDIYNISAMTKKEAKKLLFQSKEKVCIRLERESDGRVKTLKKQLHQITRQIPLAAGILTASMILSGTTNAQEQKTESPKITITQITDSKNSKPSITGTVTDSNGAVIPGIRIILRNTKDCSTRFATSNAEGFYEFKDVEPLTYEIEIVEQNGFKNVDFKNLVIPSDKNLELKFVLHPLLISEFDLAFETPVVETETPLLDNKITSRQIEDLPLPPNRKTFVLGLFPGVKEDKSKKQAKTSQISFTIFDMLKQVIPDAEVKLTNNKTKQEFIVKTNDNGIAYFSGLPHGDYEVRASATGFHNSVMRILVKERFEPNIKMSLEVGSVTGIFVFNEYKIPIFNSIIQEDVDVIKNYVAEKKNVNIRDKFSGNKTMLHAAAQSGNIEIIELLINAGANVNAKDKLGRTPILMLESDDEETVEILKLFIAKGADLNVQDKDNENTTLLMNVCEEDNYEAVKLLLEAGANPNLKDEDGKTALQKTTSEEIKKLLKKYGAK